MALGPIARVAAQAVVAGIAVLARAIPAAYGQAIANARKSGAGAATNATLSGRRLAAMLASEGLGLGLNLDDAPSAQLLEPGAMTWLG